jgi:hypothetical protein
MSASDVLRKPNSVSRPFEEDIYIKNYELVPELESELTAYFRFYDRVP